MRKNLAALSQVAMMAAIVACLVYLPAGLLLVLAARVFGVSFDALVTFGGAVHALPGLLLWWLVVFTGACGYAALMFPWGDAVFRPPDTT
jgi:hypothetical protein